MTDVQLVERPEVELHDLTATQAAAAIRAGEVSSGALVEALLRRIERSEPTLQAFVTVDAEGARAAAFAADTTLRRQGTPVGPLHGVPFAAKDIYNTAGLRTTAGFPPLADNVPGGDAETIVRLKEAGAVLIGKTVTTQFASADPPPTTNPWRADRTPGGSSSGSAAAVAARLVPFALGTQTGGSILRPAAYNGIVGLKPTYGRVSRRGIVPLAWSLDHAGPLTRSVEDAALVLGVLAGHDPADPHSLAAEVPDYLAALGVPLRRPRLALLAEFVQRAEPDVRAHVESVAARLAAAGADIVSRRLPSAYDLFQEVHRLTMQTEAATVHLAWIARNPDDYSPKIRAQAMAGQLVPAWAHLHAQRLRRLLSAEVAAALDGLDGFLAPSVSNLPPTPETTGDPSFQSPWSLLGLPAITLPSGVSDDGLPFGVQVIGKRLDESTVFRAASWIEDILGFDQHPPERA
ncbi:MAG: amidase [Chloroflexi bacterium]|nr:amidase [Chloroflexota bacterium]